MQFNELEEIKNDAYENLKISKAKMNSVHDHVSCINLSKLVKRSFYMILDYTYFWVIFEVNGPDLSLS